MYSIQLLYHLIDADTEKNVDMEDLVDEFLMFYVAGMYHVKTQSNTLFHVQDKSRLQLYLCLQLALSFSILKFIRGA